MEECRARLIQRVNELMQPMVIDENRLAQEMNGEINTIGSETTDEQISSMVVLIKTCTDSMGKQIKNIE